MRSLVALLFVALSVSMFDARTASAQFSTEPMSIHISPQYPRPHETIIITPRSTQLTLASSEVTITANGSVIERGSGERSTEFVLGGPGSSTTIRVTAIVNGVTYSAETTLRPADVSLVVEPLTTTHPLYAGASLVAPQAPVRLVAFADFRTSTGARIPSSSLTYTWRLGNKILTQESGLGRSVLSATAPVRYRDADVSVTVMTADQTAVAYAETEVSPSSGTVRAYRTDPLLGIDLAHAILGSISLRSEEESFVAVPFHFPTPPRMSWTLNGASAGVDRTLTVRAENESSGRAQVEYRAEVDGGESGGGSFTIQFGGQNRGLFGF